MAADELGCRVYRDINPVIKGPQQVWRNGVIEDKGDAVVMGDACNAFEISHVELRVSYGFGVHGLGLGRYGLLQGIQIV